MFFKKHLFLFSISLLFIFWGWRQIIKINYYIFDEIYHIPTAKLISHNDPLAFEWQNQELFNEIPGAKIDYLHPPLFKYLQALSILILGNNSLSWRLPTLIFAVGIIILTHHTSFTCFKNFLLANLSISLLLTSDLFRTESLVGKNDIASTFFILLFLFLYWKFLTQSQPINREPKKIFTNEFNLTNNLKNNTNNLNQQSLIKKKQMVNTFQLQQTLKISKPKKRNYSYHQLTWKEISILGLIAGLGLATKWNTIISLIFFFCSQIFFILKSFFLSTNNNKKELAKKIAKFVINFLFFSLISSLIYITSYFWLFFQGKNLNYFFNLQKQIIYYQTHLKSQLKFQSHPLTWIFGYTQIQYWPPPIIYHQFIDQKKQLNYKIQVDNKDFFSYLIKITTFLLCLSLVVSLTKFAITKRKPYQFINWLYRKKKPKFKNTIFTHFCLTRLITLTKISTRTNKFNFYFFFNFCGIFLLLSLMAPRALFYYHFLPLIPIFAFLIPPYFFYLIACICQKWNQLRN